MIRDYHARGKLLLTGEYVVMQGALALACPTRHRQSMYITQNHPGHIHWKALTPHGLVWLEAEWSWVDTDLMAPKKSGTPITEIAKWKPLKLLAIQSQGVEKAVSRLESWLTHAMWLSHQTKPKHFYEHVS